MPKPKVPESTISKNPKRLGRSVVKRPVSKLQLPKGVSKMQTVSINLIDLTKPVPLDVQIDYGDPEMNEIFASFDKIGEVNKLTPAKKRNILKKAREEYGKRSPRC